MAALMEGFDLCAVSDINDFVGVNLGRDDDDTLIVTTSRNVTVYKTSHQKSLHSWSVKAGEQFTCPVVQTQTADYVAVQHRQNVRLWKTDDVDVQKQKKYVLPQPIHALFSGPSREPVIIHSRGAVQTLQAAMDNPKSKVDDVLERGEKILSAGMVGEEHVILITENEQTEMRRVYIHNLEVEGDEDENVVVKLHVEATEDSTKPVLCHCVHFENKNPFMLTMWSNGSVYKTNIPLSSDIPSTSALPSHKLFSINGLTETCSVAMTMIDESHVAVLGNTDKSSPRKELLTLWDINYGTLQSTQVVHTSSPSSTHSKLFKCASSIVAVSGKTVKVYGYTSAPSTLSLSLGKCGQPLGSANVAPFSSWSTPSLPGERSGDSGRLEDLLRRLSDNTTMCETGETLSHALLDFVTGCAVHKGKMAYCVPVLLQHIISRVKIDANFWPEKSLEALVNCFQISARSCSELFPILIEKNELALLNLCCRRMTDFPEKTLARCLQYYLGLKSPQLLNAAMQTKEIQKAAKRLPSGDCPVHRCTAALINQILLCPVNDVFIVDHLRNLTFDEVMVFMNYLYYLLISVPVCEKDGISMATVIDWLCMLIDAHFTQLVIVHDARDVLLKLHRTVEDQVQFFKELGSLRCLLQLLETTKAPSVQPKQDNNTPYCIEILKL